MTAEMKLSLIEHQLKALRANKEALREEWLEKLAVARINKDNQLANDCRAFAEMYALKTIAFGEAITIMNDIKSR